MVYFGAQHIKGKMALNPVNENRGRKFPPRIGVLGPGRPDAVACELAERCGEAIARAGAILICGGLGGAMEAACRGAKRAGGLTVGILPQDHPDAANPWVDLPIVTGMGDARNVINVLTAQAVIAVRGETGTLSEIALALKCGRPVVGLDTWKLDKALDGALPLNFHSADTPEKAVALALELTGKT